MKNLILLNRSGMGPEVTCRKGRYNLDPILSRLCLASLICLCMLTVGVGQMWGEQLYFEGWEETGHHRSSGSNSYTSNSYGDWSLTYADAVSSGSPLTGSYHAILRVAKNTKNSPSLISGALLSSGETITKVSWKCKGFSGCTLKAYYSTNGSTWTEKFSSTISTTAQDKNFTISPGITGPIYLKFIVSVSSSTTSNRDANIDNITIEGTSSGGSTCMTPTFNNGTGTYNNNVSVTISTETDGATIHYRTDGTAPTCSTGTTGTSVTISSTGTVLKAIACKDGSTDSEVATATYTLKCATPTGLSTDTYVGTQTVTLATATVGANIYYTTDGSNPTASSTHYTAPFSVSSTSTIKAIAIKLNYVNSDIASATYTITPAYVVTWKNQGTTVTTTNVASGSKPVFPDMSLQSGCGKYTYFYGWAEDTWTGEVSSPGTSSTIKVYKVASEMPNVSGDVTYHAVWSDTQGGYALVESDLGSSWAGDYLIAYNENTFADGRVGGTGTGGIGKQYQKVDPDDNLSGKVVDATWGDTYHVTLEEILDNNDDPTNTYLLKTQDGQYNYQTGNSNGLSSTSTKATAAQYPITVTFTSSADVRLGLGGSAAGAVFRYNTSQYFRYYANCGQNAVYLYKKGASGGKCVTNCCTELGTINNSLTLTQGGNSVTISGWTYNAGSTGTTESNIASYTVRMYKKNGASWDLVTGSTTGGAAGTEGTRTGIATNSKSVTFTGLVVESEYKFTIAAVGASGYCDIAETPITSINSTDVSGTPFKFRYSIYIDNGSGSGWAHHYIEPTANANEGSVDITLTAHVTSYQFKIFGGFSGNWGQTGEDGVIPASTKWTLNGSYNVKLNTGAGGAYTFTVDYSGTTNPGVTVTFPSATQNSGYKIYFDKSIIAGWGNTLKYRIGNGSHNQNQDFTLVPGTDNFYVTTTPQYGSMDAWQVANNVAWSGSNSIYNYHNGDGNDITKSTIYFDYVVDGDITMVPSSKKNTDNGCDFWYVNQTDGMLTHTATITTPSNGTINLAYTDVNSAAQNKTSTTAGLAHRTKITASATPATGYQLSTFTVTPSGESAQNLTSGATDNHILAKDATFAATFTAKTYNISLDREGATTGSENVTMTYNSAEHTAITAPSKEGYTFGGWYTDDNGTGTQVMNASGTLQANVDGYTGAGGIWIKDATCTLYAKWTATPYTITYDLDGGDVATPNPTSYTIESAAITLNNPTKDGYNFAGWTGTDLGGATTTVTIAAGSTGNRSYTATWSIKHYTVTWLSNGANYVTPVDYTHGASLALPAGTPSVPGGCSSKVFVGWTAHDEISSETSVKPTLLVSGSLGTVTEDATYRAVFADEEDDEVTLSYGWEADASSDWEISGITRSNAEHFPHTGSYGGRIQTTEAYIKYKNKITPTSAQCYYTKTTTNTNQSSSFNLEYSEDGSSWEALDMGLGMNSVTQYTWYELSWSGDDKTDVYVRVVYSGTNATRAIDDFTIVCGGTSYDNYITLCSSCTTPSDLAVSGITSTGGKVAWNGVSVDDGFKVLWSTSSSRPEPATGNNADVAAGTNEYTISGLTPATRYYVWVQSKCNSEWSSSANFYTNAKITYAAGTGALGSMEPKEVTYNTNVTVDACTFTAPSGKTFNGWVSNTAVHVNGGGSTTTTVPAEATINNLTAAITLTAQWRDLASYTVHYSANNGTVAGGADQTVYENGTLTFPSVTPTCGAFVGWIEASSYSSSTMPSGATFHLAGDEIAVTDALDGKYYYAVYAEETAPEPTEDYVLIENAQTDWSGDYLIVVSYDDSGTPRNRAFDGSLATLDATSNYQDVTITSKTITSNSTTDGYKFTIAKVVGQPGKYSILSAHGEYMGSDASNTASKPNEIDQNSTLTAALYNTISYNSTESRPEILGSHATNPMILTFNKTAGQVRFRYMTSVSTAIQLYKKGGGSTYTYKTSPSCSPTVATSTPAGSFTYVYDNGPSASQTFQVSGSNLSANLNVAAPSNYEVSADNSSFSSSINITPTDGRVATTTVYIRLAAGLNVGSYNGGVITVSSTGADDDVSATLTGSVTKAAGSIAFTDFNAVDHYEAEMAAGASSVDVTLTVSVTGDGAVSYSRSPAAGSSAVPATTPTTTLHVTTVGTWTVTANLAAGTNYTSASTNCQVVVYYADRFYDNLHGNDVIVKRNDTGEDHYTIPSLSDESRQTSGTCSETHYHFMGWVPEAALGSLTDDASYTAVMITSGTQAASGTNYYAVWAEE